MRVLMTTDTVGGVWTYAIELARSLAAEEVDVVLATMGAPVRPDQRAQAEAVVGLSLRESEYRLEWMDDCWDDVRRAGDWLLEIEAEVRPDVVHLNGYAHGSLDWQAPVLVVGHSDVLSWWEAVKRETAPDKWDQYRAQVGGGIRRADYVAAPTSTMLDLLARHYGPLPESGVVYNGRDRRLFAPVRKEPFVFSAGRLWDEAKNLRTLDVAAPSVEWPVYVAGPNSHPEGGEAVCSNVRCLGTLPLPDVSRWMGRASIYALPARYEPFGLSAVEAGLSGCALVLGDIPTLREVWDDAAVFVDPDDPATLARAINDLAGDPEQVALLARRARHRASIYSVERMAQRYLALYLYLQRTGRRARVRAAADS